jgi:predicted Zn-dependent peptidase
MLNVLTGKIGAAHYAFCPMDEVESVSVGLWFNVGSRHEPKQLQGGSHFLEHMMFKGTRQRNALAISQQIEGRGGDLNAFTSEEMTCYYARMDADHVELVLEVLFDMLWNSTLPAVEMERERGVILEEIRMYEDQPSSLVMDRLNEVLWPGPGPGLPIAGTPQSVSAMKRSDLIGYWKNNYHPGSLTLSMAGSFSPEKIEKKVLAYLKGRKLCSGLWSERNVIERKTKSNSKIRQVSLLALPRPVQQGSVSLGIHGFPRKSPLRYAEKLLSVIMGENMSSRLFQVLREKHGLAYSVHTSTNHFHDCGAFYLQAGLETAKLAEAMKLTAREFLRIAQTKPSPQELKRAKDFLMGQMKLSMESTSNRMMWMGESLIGLGRIQTIKEIVSEIQAVTPEQVSAVAKMLFQPGRMTLACVGPDVDSKLLREASRHF